MKFSLIEEYDNERDLYKIRAQRKLEDVAEDVALILLRIDHPSEDVIKNLADDIKYHKETFLEMIEQDDVLLDEVKQDLKNKINRLRI